jgi:hypothetical protein
MTRKRTIRISRMCLEPSRFQSIREPVGQARGRPYCSGLDAARDPYHGSRNWSVECRIMIHHEIRTHDLDILYSTARLGTHTRHPVSIKMTSPETKENRERNVAFLGRMNSAEGSERRLRTTVVRARGHATLGTQYISFGSSIGIYFGNTSSSRKQTMQELTPTSIPVLGYASVGHYPRGYSGIMFQIMRSDHIDHSQMEQSREKPQLRYKEW